MKLLRLHGLSSFAGTGVFPLQVREYLPCMHGSLSCIGSGVPPVQAQEFTFCLQQGCYNSFLLLLLSLKEDLYDRHTDRKSDCIVFAVVESGKYADTS